VIISIIFAIDLRLTLLARRRRRRRLSGLGRTGTRFAGRGVTGGFDRCDAGSDGRVGAAGAAGELLDFGDALTDCFCGRTLFVWVGRCMRVSAGNMWWAVGMNLHHAAEIFLWSIEIACVSRSLMRSLRSLSGVQLIGMMGEF
jgi:hypothetical protein